MQIENKNFLCIPLCDGVRFQDYVADVCNKTAVHVNSLRNNNRKNATSKAITTTFLMTRTSTPNHILNRVQFDSYSCGVWLVARIASYIHSLPLPSRPDDAFDNAYSLLEQKAKITVDSFVPASSNCKSEDHINFFSTSHFLGHALMEDPKGIRSNFLYQACN